MQKFKTLETTIDLHFKDQELLENVFVHRSYLNEHKKFYLPSNEKLEFLGDSVLSLITSIYIYRKYPQLQEGDYTDIKAAIVRTESLAEVARKLKLGDYLYLSKGEERGEGRSNMNILADCFEALIAAIFIDHNFEAAYVFVSKHLFKDTLDHIVENKLYLSPKSRLQEIAQARYRVLPSYETVEESGPEHRKYFKVAVSIKRKLLAQGTGNSKKMAEEQAAKNALDKLR